MAILFGFISILYHDCRTGSRRLHRPVYPGPPYLGGHEVRGVAGCHEQPILGSQLLGKPEVTDADGLGVPGLVHVQYVARLQVPMHDLGGWTDMPDLGPRAEREREGAQAGGGGHFGIFYSEQVL